ncbi:MAG: hypothetical protein OXC84_09565 [Gammaproteobacteria bacterium]|nr:hypothetical protein [Gammaproteobacteria bacterium]
MKVFVPMSDLILRERSELTGKPVPFNPEFLGPGMSQNTSTDIPRNWTDDDDVSACRRLKAIQGLSGPVIA